MRHLFLLQHQGSNIIVDPLLTNMPPYALNDNSRIFGSPDRTAVFTINLVLKSEYTTMINIPSYGVSTKIYESSNSLVYRSIRNQDNQPIILKFLKEDYPTPEELTRYKQEYEITRNLNLEGVIRAYSLEKYQNSLVMFLEDFGGESLKILMNSIKFTLGEFLNLAIQVVEILGEIHAANIMHKDINPSNIVFNPETGQIKIIDFGISTILSRENPTIKNPNVLEGTLTYISPEQTGRMNRLLDYRTDFYSLGVTFYELLTYQLPFDATDAMELVHCHIAKQPVPPHEINPEIPKAVSDIVMKLVAKTAEERYQSAWGLKADLEECLTQLQANGQILDFPLGRQDVSDKFQIPQKLYSREPEIEILLTAFDRVSQGKSEMMLVSGYSGIGKSALVQEIYKPITRQRGYFISGKFDQFQRNIPYSAAIKAFQELMRQLLTESEAQLNQWQEKLLVALGPNGQVIIDVIPEVELIIGKQPAVIELGSTESQNRFKLVFQNFIRVFCSKEHPLVIFLDDLQWADSATLNLLNLVMTDNQTQYLFLIGAYRDNEVNPTHPLMMTVEALQKEGSTINQITLVPLKLEHISQLIAETLHSDIKTVRPLAELVVQKTGANPFFVNEFLKTLHAENLIKFDVKKLSWQWDISTIQAMGITDNVVELIIGKLKKLPESTQQILRLAACVGAEFDLKTLSIICVNSASEVFKYITVAVHSGLVLPLSELDFQLLIQEYKFAHDRVQQAAYALIDEAQKQVVHLQIGRLLLQKAEPEVLTEKIFDIVDHLNIGVELVTDREERDEIARLNLMAGQKAKAATAYDAAVKYLNVGLGLLAEDSWQSQYDLTLMLYVEATESTYLKGEFEVMEQLAGTLLKNARDLLDKIRVYETKLQAYSVLNRFLDGVQLGLSCLRLLGIDLPENPESSEVESWLAQTQNALDRFTLDELLNMPNMTNPAMLGAMRILTRMISLSYFSRPSLFPLISCQGILLSIEYGNAIDSPVAYVDYGLVLCSPSRANFRAGYRYGHLAKSLLEKQGNKQFKPFVLNNFNSYIAFWKEHTRNTLAPLQDAYRSGLEVGDLEFAAYALTNYLRLAYSLGQELSKLKQEFENGIEFVRSIHFEGTLQYTLCMLQTILNLMGEADKPWHLKGVVYDEDVVVPLFQQSGNLLGLSIHYFNNLMLNYLFGRVKQAAENANEGEGYAEFISGHHPLQQFALYAALANLASVTVTADIEKQMHLDKANHWRERLKHWAEHAPMNFQHKYDLVEAEKARILGQHWQAAELYERAIKGARNNGYIQEEALAYELAAEFYLARGMDKIAQTYMKDAHYGYVRWQAWAKVDNLESRYPQFLPKSAATRITNTGTKPTITITRTQSGEALDLATVMKAAQAISGEIVLSKLLEKLMEIVIENAGAQKGFLILSTNGELRIEAAGEVDRDSVTVLQSIPVNTSQNLPTGIVNYVVRSQLDVVLSDASSEGIFTTDSYITKKQPKSVLCAPIINQGKLIGILYLENNLTTGAFTPDRLEVLRILSSQAAISIENALLYQILEQKVSERTTQLAQANAEILALNERLKADNLRMSAELEVTRQLQQMILPKESELRQIEELDIAGFMKPADEVGGDYYDVLKHNGQVKIGIGDVTGHGLESGVLMIMVQTAVRALLANNETDPVKFLNVLNRTIYDNVVRMNSDKNLTLSLLDYQNGTLRLSGQHEEIIVVRCGGKLERIDTIDLGFPIGLEADIAEFVAQTEVQLHPGDVVVLYTDGITEAENIEGVQYGLERLCEAVRLNWQRSASEIKQAVIDDVEQHIGEQRVYDDITLVVLKQK